MALIEQTILDKFEVVGQFRHIQCRQDNQIVDDTTGEVKSKGNWHRYALAPGDDVSEESAELQAVAAVLWTQEVLDAWETHLEAMAAAQAARAAGE